MWPPQLSVASSASAETHLARPCLYDLSAQLDFKGFVEVVQGHHYCADCSMAY